jgi:hypothetical protein
MKRKINMALKTKTKKTTSKAAQMQAIREKNAKNQPSANVDKSELIVSDKSKKPLDILPPLSDEQKQSKAVEDDKRFRALETTTRQSFVEMMFILREFKAYELHRYLNNKQGKKFSSFDAWLKEAAPLSRASGYAALRAAEKLLPIIPKKDLEAMPRYSVELLAKVPKLKLEPAIIKAAQTQNKKELTKTIQNHAPEAHVEAKRKINVEASAGSVIDRALEAAIALGELANEAEALEYLANFFLSGPCELEQFSGMDNAQAFNAWKQNREAAGTEQDISQPDSAEQAGEGEAA